MRLAGFLWLCFPVLYAESITPNITQTVTESGNVGFTGVTGTYSSTAFEFGAMISGSASTYPGPPNGGGQAEADITLEAAFLVAGTGTGYLHYSTTGESDGSGGAFDSSYQLNDIDASCLVDCSASGLDPIQLGTPFVLSETGTAYAFSGPFPEDASYQVSVAFTVTDANGDPLPFAEVALPTPEPGSFILLAAGSIVALGAGWLLHSRVCPNTLPFATYRANMCSHFSNRSN